MSRFVGRCISHSECPLWVIGWSKSRQTRLRMDCPLCAKKRTSRDVRVVSALSLKAPRPNAVCHPARLILVSCRREFELENRPPVCSQGTVACGSGPFSFGPPYKVTHARRYERAAPQFRRCWRRREMSRGGEYREQGHVRMYGAYR